MRPERPRRTPRIQLPRQLDPRAIAPWRDLAVDAQVRRIEDAIGAALATRIGLRGLAARAKDDDDLRDVARRAVIEAAGAEPDAAHRDALAALGRIRQPVRISDALMPELPLRDNPLFRPTLDRQALERLTDWVPADRREQLVAALKGPHKITPARLQDQIDQGALDRGQAQRLGMAANLYVLLDEDEELAARLAERLSQDGTITLRGLARLDPAALPEALGVAGIEDEPERLATAHRLAAAAAALSPATALISRHLRRAVPERVSDPEGAAELAGLFPGLGLEEILADGSREPEARVQAVAERLGALSDFELRNDHVDLMRLDLSAGGSGAHRLDFGDLSSEDQGRVTSVLRSYQRIYRLTDDVDVSSAVLAAGLGSAHDIARMEEPSALADRTGLTPELATDLFEQALQVELAVGIRAGALLEELFTRGPGLGFVPPEADDFLRGIDGYDVLFGNRPACTCTHCRSVLGPPAYFVDLMDFVQQHVTRRVFAGAHADHELALPNRRPDLWTLPLTCEASEALLPTLDLVNRVLERLADRYLDGHDPTRSDDDVRERVEAALGSRVDAFDQPVHLDRLRADLQLDLLGTPWHALARAALAPLGPSDADRDRLAALGLGLSAARVREITHRRTTRAELDAVFHGALPAAPAALDPIDAAPLSDRMGVTREALGALVATRFVNASVHLASDVVVVGDRLDPNSVQNDVEYVRNLTLDRLDRLHRLARLHRAVPDRTVRELDLILRSLQVAGVGNTLDGAQLAGLAEMLEIAELHALSTDETCGLFAELLDQSSSGDRPPLFDRRFNPGLGGEGGASERWPAGASWIHPLHRSGAPASADPVVARLSAGLGIDDAALASLLEVLAAPLGLTFGTASSSDRALVLNRGSLSLLYRHARLMRLHDLEPVQLRAALALLGVQQIATPRQVLRLADLVARAKQRDRDLAALAPAVLPLGHPEAAGLAAAGAQLAERLREQIASAGALDAPLAPSSLPELLVAALSAEIDTALPRVRQLSALVGLDLATAELGAVLAPGSAAPAADHAGMIALREWIRAVVRLREVTAAIPEPERLQGREAAFGLGSWRDADLATVHRLDALSGLLPRDGDQSDVIVALLDGYAPATGFGSGEALTEGLGIPATLAGPLDAVAPRPTPAVDALLRIAAWSELCRTHGLGPSVLRHVAHGDPDAVAGAVADALRLQTEARAGSERVASALRERRRDALISFLIHSVARVLGRDTRPPFLGASDVSNHVLTDVLAGGCARTSRLVFGISALQTYVQRCLLDLEQDRRDPSDPGYRRVPVENIPQEQWGWRKQYRLWEANRKIFLFPESYLEPDLRDDKTPLFEQLEAQLLGQDINEQAVLDAYDAYLKGFAELAQLTISGSYHHRTPGQDVLHLFGVTADDPPVHYHRTIHNIGYSDRSAGIRWSPWRRAEVQIPVRKVSPIVYRGQLHVFWSEITTKPQMTLVESRSNFVGYHHTMALKLSTLRLDGTWTAPQRLTLEGHPPFRTVDGLVEDPNVEPEEQQALEAQLRVLTPWTMPLFDAEAFSAAILATMTPRHAVVPHPKPKDEYTLRGDLWDRVYPGIHPADGRLTVTGRRLRLYAPVDLFRRRVGEGYGTDRDGARIDPRGSGVSRIPCVASADPGTLDVTAAYTRTWPDALVVVHPYVYDARPRLLTVDQNHAAAVHRILAGGTLELASTSFSLSPSDSSFPYEDPPGPMRQGTIQHLVGTGFAHVKLAIGKGPTDTHDVVEHWWILETATWGSLGVERFPLETPTFGGARLSWMAIDRFALEDDDFLVLVSSTYAGPAGIWALIRVLKMNWNYTSFTNKKQDSWRPLGFVRRAAVIRAHGAPHLVVLNTNRQALLFPIGSDGQIAAEGTSVTLDWSALDVTWFRSGSRSFLLFVRAESNGENVAVYEIVPGGRMLKHAAYDFDEGWHRAERFAVGGRQYALLYNALNRHLRTFALNESGLYEGTPSTFQFDAYAHAHLALSDARLAEATQTRESLSPSLAATIRGDLYERRLAGLDQGALLDTVNGSVGDCIIQVAGDTLLLQSSVAGRAPWTEPERPDWFVRRLNTTLAEQVSELLFTEGIGGLLDSGTQRSLRESSIAISPTDERIGDLDARSILKGPFGLYYQELFLYVPWAIASHLRSRGRHADAQRWYHRLFDPTATETGASSSIPRAFRYLGFRSGVVDDLRSILIDSDGIDAYLADPFNPHAIARTRRSAYAKAIVLEYVENLLDWGDALFTRFTTESLREATQLYAYAQDILGPRPATLGACGENAAPVTYAEVVAQADAISPFLREIEHVVVVGFAPDRGAELLAGYFAHYASVFEQLAASSGRSAPTASQALAALLLRTGDATEALAADPASIRETAAPTRAASRAKAARQPQGGAIRPSHGSNAMIRESGRADRTSARQDGIARGESAGGQLGGQILESTAPPSLGLDVLRQVGPLFCIPRNERLTDAWDRVGDRLHKLRSCQNIDGVFGLPSLYAPPLDPAMLARARAAGLDLADVAADLAAPAPLHRFPFLLGRARTLLGTVQSLGDKLLSLLERQDAEEMGQLRAVHEQHLLELNTEIQDWEVQAAEETLASQRLQLETATFRQAHYQSLLDEDLLPAERTQQVARHVASTLSGISAGLDTLAGIFHLVPQLGSPFAMKFGGLELGSSASSWSGVLRDAAQVAEAIAGSAGVEAGNARRRQDWKLQRDLAARDVAQQRRQIAVSELRRDIATRTARNHHRRVEQAGEVFELLKDKFSNLGRYTWLATETQRLHRQLYLLALDVARQTERALRFERPELDDPPVISDAWDAPQLGLMAAERLSLMLSRLEERYHQTDTRSREIRIPVSLARLDPTALVALRQTGSCTFHLPEALFDLAYPGQYRRHVKSVSLTIPCVTGPFTTVGAELELLGSTVRDRPLSSARIDVPRGRANAIATSSGQADAGLFELLFRDERFLPFEGAGVDSRWRLRLPSRLRTFDYGTISDVVMQISYTARYDEDLRTAVESDGGALDAYLTQDTPEGTPPLAVLFSLKTMAPDAFHRLITPGAPPAAFAIDQGWFPYFLGDRRLARSRAVVAVKTRSAPAGPIQVALGGAPTALASADDRLSGVLSAEITAAVPPGIVGDYTASLGGAPGDLALVDDVWLYIGYRAAPIPA